MIKKLLLKATDTLKQYDMTFKLLLIYVVTIPVMKTPYHALLAQRIQFSETVFLFLFFLWVKDLVKRKQLPHDPGLNKPFLLFAFFCLLSFFNSTNLFTSTIELLGLIYLYIMLILVTDMIDSKKKLDTVIKTWIATLAVVMALGLIGWCAAVITGEKNAFCWTYYGIFPYLKNKTVYRILSTFRDPTGLSVYLLVSLSFVISDLLLTNNKRYKIFLKVMLFFLCLVMIATISRELLGLMLASFLIYSYFHKKKDLKFKVIRFFAVSFMIILFLFITIFCSAFHIRSYEIGNLSKGTHKELVINVDYAFNTRLALKIAALEMIKRHPFLGVGLAMYPSYAWRLNNEAYFYFKNLTPLYDYVRGGEIKYFNYLIVNDPHCDVLQYFAETGIFGGAAFILFIAAFLYLVFTNLKKWKGNQYFKVRLFCLAASFIAVLVTSIDLDVFKARFIWFMMALVLALVRMHKKEVIK